LPNRDIEIYADFYDDGDCNAAAGIHRYMGLIGISKGAILLPLDLFYRMFSHPLVMSGIGNSRAERRGPAHDEGIVEDYDVLAAKRIKAGRSPLPKPPLDSTRQAVATICIDLTWGFIVMHELVHLLHGHVEYLRQSRGLSCLLEILQSRQIPSLSTDDLDFQTLEFWADEKAMTVVLRGLLGKSNGTDLQSIFPRPEDKLFLWSFAMFTLFRIWGLRIDPASLEGRKHPPTALRFHATMVGAAFDVSRHFSEVSEHAFWDSVYAGQREAEKGIAYCGAKRLVEEDVIGTRDPRVDAHCTALGRHFRDVLFGELKKYSFVELGPFPA
jgi:hypothetical protein